MQCSKSLYLYKNKPQQRDALSASQQAIFSRGNSVGILAQQLFPGGIDASPADKYNYTEACTTTQKLIEQQVPVIYEAAFQFEGVYAALDILVKQDDKWIAYEVKSSAKISAAYLMDAALQYSVITKSGLSLADFQLVYLDTAYVKRGPIEIDKLFIKKSCWPQVLQRQEQVAAKITELKALLISGVEPDIKIGEHCHSPYACDFIGTCRGSIEEDSIFYFAGLSRQQQYEFYTSGIKKIADLPLTFSFSQEQKIQYDCCVSGQRYIDFKAVAEFIQEVRYPLSFLDFEMFMPAIPIYEGSSPYEHIPFLYSMHSKIKKEAALEHTGFLAETGAHPLREFILHLIEDLGNEGDILVFDPTHEQKILNKAIQLFPEFKTALQQILLRIKDLSTPFRKKHYYLSAMKGSYSMKFLLPAIAPELTFDTLSIKNGISALAAFENLQKEADLFKTLEIREALMEYCKMDTLGLVKIFEALEEVIP